MDNLVWWLMTAAITAIGIIIWTFLAKFDNKLDALKELVGDEMRSMDVRVTRLESHIWPHNKG